MVLEKGKKYLIIADYDYHSILLDVKKWHSSIDIKVITEEELLDIISFSYAKDPIPYLLKEEKEDYSRLKKRLKLLRVADLSRSEELSKLKADLTEKGFIQEDPYRSAKLQDRELLLFEDDEDLEIPAFLKRAGLPFGFLHFIDLDYQPAFERASEQENQPVIYSFLDKFSQYLFIYSDIRKRIIDDHADPHQIHILIKDSSDCYYTGFFSDLFGIRTETQVEIPLLSDADAKKNIDSFFRHQNFEFIEEPKEGTPSAQIQKIIRNYGLAELKDFSFAYSVLLELISANKFVETQDKDGITTGSRIYFDTDDQIYVTDFDYGDFYKVYEDSNVYDDKTLESLSVNPSYVLTKLDRRKKLNFLTYNHIIFASSVRLHLDDKIFESQFLSEEGWKAKEPDYNPNGLYTKKALALLQGAIKDDQYAKPDSEYKTYQHAYQTITSSFPEKKEGESITGLKSFFECPFSYYLERVLRIDDKDPNQDTYPMKYGDFVHHIFENIYADDFDFEKNYQKALVSYAEDCRKRGQEFTAAEHVYLEISHDWLKNTAEAVSGQRLFAKFCRMDPKEDPELAEQKVFCHVTSLKSGKTYHLNGRIDKIVYTQGPSGNRYYTIFDYKTGKDKFSYQEVFLGGSLQLPLYALALDSESNEFVKGYQFGGFGIQHLGFKSFSEVRTKKNALTSDSIRAALKVRGIAYSEPDYFMSIDSTAFTKKGDLSVSRAKYLKPYGLFSGKASHLTDEYSYGQFLSDVEAGALASLERIDIHDFAIAPIIKNPNSTEIHCRYCHFKDICYKAPNNQDARCVADDIYRHFHLNEFADSDEDDDDDSEEQ